MLPAEFIDAAEESGPIRDLGTGCSSFTHLKQFPVDELEIDRSFVTGMTTDAGDRAIVASCVHLAHAMGLVAVAEGVETPDERDALRELGCDQAQGYFSSRPLPPSTVVLEPAAATA